jgi:hypothetical protein
MLSISYAASRYHHNAAAIIAALLPSEPKSRPPVEIPDTYKDLKDVFEKRLADKLPPNRSYDHAINLKPDAQIPWSALYSLSPDEDAAMLAFLKENLPKGFIRPSTSSAAAGALFVRKKLTKELRLCLDYRAMNDITVKDRYPLPKIDELLDRLTKAKIFTRLDLRGAYNLLRIKPGDEWKTAFRTRYGLFEFCVMPFGLCNAPASFQRFMNDTLRDVGLDVCVICYLDDILIFSENPDDHTRHVRAVLQQLLDAGLYVKLDKCEFNVTETTFVGYHISQQGISMEQAKVESILEWKFPHTVKGMQIFLGFANFYRRFIKGFARIVEPLQQLTRKDAKSLNWDDPVYLEAFENLKNAFTSAPVLRVPDVTKPFFIETDASKFAIGQVLSQVDPKDNELHPVAYRSRSLAKEERAYGTPDQELLSVITAFKNWRHYLMGAQTPTTVITDHKNLIYHSTSRLLNDRQIRWALQLQNFNFKILHRPGAQHGNADALSRREDLRPPTDTEPHPAILPPDIFIGALVTQPQPESSLLESIKAHNITDTTFAELKKKPQYSVKDGLLFHKSRLYVPPEDRDNVLHSCHDSPIAGHFGRTKTLELVRRPYFWPGLHKDVAKYVHGCDACTRASLPTTKPQGFLQPLPIPTRMFGTWGLDFFSGMPQVDKYDCILVATNHLNKKAIFIPCSKEVDARQTADLFISHVFKDHGIPDNIVADRGPQFVSKFFQALFSRLGCKVKLTSARHAETNGQTENLNKILGRYIRTFQDHAQTNWLDMLPLAQFSYNNSYHTAIGMSPFMAMYGCHPKFTLNNEPDYVPAATERATSMHETVTLLQQRLTEAKSLYTKNANRHRLPTPTFAVGEKVWLSSKGLSSDRTAPKFADRRQGPFPVIAKINDESYRLDLPARFKCHNVFHVSLLYAVSPHHRPVTHPNPPPITDLPDTDPEWELDCILKCRKQGRGYQYLIHWKGYSHDDDIWIPPKNLKNAMETVEKFHQENPDVVRPPAHHFRL